MKWVDMMGVRGEYSPDRCSIEVRSKKWQGVVRHIFVQCMGHEPRANCSQDEIALERIEKSLAEHIVAGVADDLWEKGAGNE